MLAKPECEDLTSWDAFCDFPPVMGLACRARPQCCVMNEGARGPAAAASACNKLCAGAARAAVLWQRFEAISRSPPIHHPPGFAYIHLVAQAGCMLTKDGG